MPPWPSSSKSSYLVTCGSLPLSAAEAASIVRILSGLTIRGSAALQKRPEKDEYGTENGNGNAERRPRCYAGGLGSEGFTGTLRPLPALVPRAGELRPFPFPFPFSVPYSSFFAGYV